MINPSKEELKIILELLHDEESELVQLKKQDNITLFGRNRLKQIRILIPKIKRSIEIKQTVEQLHKTTRFGKGKLKC